MVGTDRIIVLMGVSGCGKSLVGKSLSDELGFQFIEGDDFHSLSSKKKMAAGIPLNDEDREGWLCRLRDLFHDSNKPLIASCSSLKKSYRNLLNSKSSGLLFIHLHGSERVIAERLEGRSDHFFNPQLLASQFTTLETLQPDENGFEINIDQAPHLVVAQIISRLKH